MRDREYDRGYRAGGGGDTRRRRAADRRRGRHGRGLRTAGLPGDEGFWRAYPPLAHLGISFEGIANPEWFYRDPELAWGFYGHRLNLYRRTMPHDGFGLLLRWAAAKPAGCFVYTSNVDGQFQRAGFDPERIVEAHGSLHRLQCPDWCRGFAATWEAEEVEVTVDEAVLRAARPLPACPSCGGTARPNLLMFQDRGWMAERYEAQEESLQLWLSALRHAGARLTVIECGAGRAIPTVRRLSDSLYTSGIAAHLVRINPRDPGGPVGTLSLALGAREALTRIQGEWDAADN